MSASHGEAETEGDRAERDRERGRDKVRRDVRASGRPVTWVVVKADYLLDVPRKRHQLVVDGQYWIDEHERIWGPWDGLCMA